MMKKILLIGSWLFSATLLVSCGKTDVENTVSNEQACDVGPVQLLADFEASRMDKCANLGNNNFAITITPENTPINNSPWYAFRIQADQAAKANITIQIAGDRANRYLPKVSQDKQTWRVHPHKTKGKLLTLTVDASPQVQYIAAQEIIDNEYYAKWSNRITGLADVSYDKLGESQQGRAIYKLESKADSNEWLVILGRLHPPEVTGALALFPFVETLLANNPIAAEFRQRYNLLIIPNLNPDGVAMGNWRHNANGFDLNRDWIKLAQPETQLVDQYLRQLIGNQQKIKFAIDFHSTKRDVFYTMPVDYGVEQRYFVEHWLNDLDKAMPNFEVVQQPGNKPNNGVSKQYFADNYNVHAVTYEAGDESDRNQIKSVANNAASLLMKTMMSDVDHNIE